MREQKKSCKTCEDSFYLKEEISEGRITLRQHCANPDYCSASYTMKQLLEDWTLGYCRFWRPKAEKGLSDYEKHIFH